MVAAALEDVPGVTEILRAGLGSGAVSMDDGQT
jgi:diphosphomevalonate decarboxylase